MANNLNEGRRLVTTGTAGDRSYKVYKDTEWGEFVVKFYAGGVHDANADYHTDDQTDATDTAKRWLRSAVTEMFQSGKNWKWTDTSPGVAEAKFEVRGIPYRFWAQKEDSGTWHLIFSNQGPGRSSFGRTRDGNSIEVFSVVIDIMRSLLKTRGHEIEEIEFEAAADDPARATLYRKMLRRLIPDGWDYTYEWGDDGGRYTIFPEKADVNEDWQKINRADKTDGMSKKAVDAYRKEHPGSKLKTAVTKDPSKIKPGSADDKRRDAFCSRMSGAKRTRASAETKRDPNSRINLALKRWNCNEGDAVTEMFQSGKNWVWRESKTNDHMAVAEFEVGGVYYVFEARGNEPRSGPSTDWIVSFANLSQSEQSHGLTGDGNSVEVLSTVTDIMRSFVARYSKHLDSIQLTAKERSRRNLYERMIKRLLPTWELTISNSIFTVRRPKDTAVTEVFQSGKNWQWVKQDDDHVVAKFEVGGVPFRFSAEDDSGGEGLWNVSFADASYPDQHDFGMTGKGNSVEVFSVVVDIMRSFVQNYRDKITTMMVLASGDTRTRLYAKMAKRLLPNWEVDVDEMDVGEMALFIHPPQNRRVSESTSTAGVYGMALNEMFDDDGSETPPPVTDAGTMSWIELSSAVSSAAEEMGWKVRPQGESGMMFSIHEREGDDEYRFVGIADVDGNSFEYTTGKIGGGRPEIEENEVLPNSEEGIGQLLRVFQVEFNLPDETVVEMAHGVARVVSEGTVNEFFYDPEESGEGPEANYPCYDCGSTILGHHTKLCDLAEDWAIHDLPAVPGTQYWTREIPKGLKPIPGLEEGIAEGADEEVPDDVAAMIEKIASGTSSPENKKAAIDAIVAKQKKETTVEETADPTQKEREQAMYGTSFPTSDGISWQDVRLMAGEGKLSKKTVLQALEAIRKQRR